MKSEPKINSDNPILLYEQIKIGIKNYIHDNKLKVGEKIPNETELGKIFDVSRITVRRAIKELVAEHVIEVIRGKGTFVTAPKKNIHLLNLQGFTEGLSTENNEIKKEIIMSTVISDTSEIPKILRNEYGEVFKLVRLVKDSDGPLSVDYAYLPTIIYPGIEALLSDNVSTFQLIRENYDVKFAKAEKEIEYINPSPEICKHLGVNETATVILVRKVIYDSNQLPVHYSQYYLSGDRVKFYIDVDYTE